MTDQDTRAMTETPPPAASATASAAAAADPTVRAYLRDKHVAALLERFVKDLVTDRPEDVTAFMAAWAAARCAAPTAAAADASASAADSDDEGASLKSTTHEAVRRAWNSLPEKTFVTRTFFELALTQHRAAGRALLSGLDPAALAAPLAAVIDGVVNGTLDNDELAELARVHGAPRRLEPRHHHYFITAMLSALAIALGDQFPPTAEGWRVTLTAISEHVQAAIAAAPAAAEGAGSAPTPPPEPEPAAVAAAADAEATQLATAWRSIADRKASVTDVFFQVLTAQHPALQRGLLAGYEIPALSARLASSMDDFVAGALPLEEIARLAAAHAPRGVETKHAHYFVTSMLTALSVALGRDAFAAIADPWRVLLTDIAETVQAAVVRRDLADTSMEVDAADTGAGAGAAGAGSGPAATPRETAVSSWAALGEERQAAVSKTFLDVLLTQHRSLRRPLIGEDDAAGTAKVAAALAAFLGGFLGGSLEPRDVEATVTAAAEGKPVERKHGHYFVTSMLSALSIELKGAFPPIAEHWRVVLTEISEAALAVLKL